MFTWLTNLLGGGQSADAKAAATLAATTAAKAMTTAQLTAVLGGDSKTLHASRLDTLEASVSAGLGRVSVLEQATAVIPPPLPPPTDPVAQVSPPFVLFTGGTTVTWDCAFAPSVNAWLTLKTSGKSALIITRPANGTVGTLLVTHDAAGSTLTLPDNSVVVNAGAMPWSAAAGSRDMLSFTFDGTTFWWTFGKAFARPTG